MALGSSRSYLIRALYDWIVEGGEDPFVIVDCLYPGVEVPESHVKDGQIVLNLAPRALNGWSMAESAVVFQTRFDGIPTDIVLPYGSVTAIYGQESGLGMAFGQEPGGVPEPLKSSAETQNLGRNQDDDSTEADSTKPNRPELRIVKSED
ncbi:MAG TPA: ClpXP protease specificity-enhancing factor [Gammaproteobacteria bacterium]|nr:ClpXP protease specificity-enhancing factor [Gammaproteobacteria bacterium]HBX26899.1 ClpXP protease specificity-enhancing factor [Gammaproteobacteria bacterium]|tara:strand:- start:3162 stop:3611 length:450 start_codon:yes stop_codon:yes gene_type:complete